MMSDDNSNDEQFLAIIAESPALSEKWSAITESVMNLAAESGATITAEDVLRIPSARLAAMTNEGLSDTFLQRELASLPAVREAHRARAVRDEIEAGEQSGIDSIAHLSAAEKMEFARANGLMRGVDHTQKVEKLSPVEEAKLVRNIEGLSPSARLNIARKYGLGI